MEIELGVLCMLGKPSIIATWPSCFYKEWRTAGAVSIKAYKKIS